MRNKPIIYPNNGNKKATRNSAPEPFLKSSQKKTAYKIPELTDDPEITSLRNQLLQNPDFSQVENEKLKRVVSSLREYAFQKGTIAEYDEAEKASELVNQIKQELNDRIPNESNEEELIGGLTSRRNDFESKWQSEIGKYDQETEDKRNALMDKHEIESQEFEKQWNEEMPQKYRKPSSSLLQLKKIEKNLTLSGDYTGAKKVHQEAEALAEHEMQLAQEKLFREYRVAQTRMQARHQKKLELYDQERSQGKILLLSKYKNAKDAIFNRGKVIETKKKETRKSYSQGTTYGPSGTAVLINNYRSDLPDVLLPPLKAPNDPEVVREQNQKRREMLKKKLEYQRMNAAQTLLKYQDDDNLSKSSNKTGNDDNDSVTFGKHEEFNTVSDDSDLQKDNVLFNITQPSQQIADSLANSDTGNSEENDEAGNKDNNEDEKIENSEKTKHKKKTKDTLKDVGDKVASSVKQ